ncbi:uncharacterized protein RCO7_15239 [Rhynchosporium graminicola]|uniref:Uncharacterized protein n=1 Tax=Rhynchosporium graminicola TaxID=2792576 RepID=A0A1E1LS95_9HELO|nr:uncharacterized protein RCO7_15239 [Rhynchosporium commune]
MASQLFYYGDLAVALNSEVKSSITCQSQDYSW